MSSASHLNESVFSTLDKERLAIWQAHPDWSEQRRQQAWSQRRAQIASYLFGNGATTQEELEGTSLALTQGADRGQLVRDLSLVAMSGLD